MCHETENIHLKIIPYFRARRSPRGVFLHVTPNGLSEKGTTRSLDSSKGEVCHVVHVWK